MAICYKQRIVSTPALSEVIASIDAIELSAAAMRTIAEACLRRQIAVLALAYCSFIFTK